MKFSSLTSKLAVVATLATMGASHFAIAQPNTAPAMGGKAKHGRKGKGGLSAKAQSKIETALGKPLTADQKAQLDTAANTRKAATKAAQDAFDNEVARVTGLPLEKVRAAGKTPKTKA